MCTDSTSSLIHPVSKGVAVKPDAGIKQKNNRSTISKLFTMVTLSSLSWYMESQFCFMHCFATQWGSFKKKKKYCLSL